VEENESLRAELDEWSVRTAKVSKLDTVIVIAEEVHWILCLLSYAWPLSCAVGTSR
jgi:hypothetical protein